MVDEREKTAFNELKKRLKGCMDDDLYEDDNVFYRFLKARDLNVNAAEIMLKNHLEWRKKIDLKNIFEFKPPEVLEKYLPINFIGYAKEGNVVRFIPTGNFDYRGLMASCTIEMWDKYLIKIYEEDTELLRKKSAEAGKLIDKGIYIHSLKGLTFAKATDKEAVCQFIQFSNIYQDNYPETLKQLFVINVPPFVSLLVSILKTFLPSKVLKKIKIFTDDSFKKELLELIDDDVLPAFLGGKVTDPDGNPLCHTFINHAGLIPKEYYMKTKETFPVLPDVQKLTVPRGTVHELNLEIEEPGSLLEWEFLIKHGDIKFGVAFQDTGNTKTEVVPLEKVTTDEDLESGVHKCENAGTYVLIFDNSLSFMRSKDIFYKLNITPPRIKT